MCIRDRLKEPLKPEHIKKKIVGHWGTVPGQNLIYVHLNRIIKQYNLDMILLSGPGHGGNFFVANTYLEGTYSEVYPCLLYTSASCRSLRISSMVKVRTPLYIL